MLPQLPGVISALLRLDGHSRLQRTVSTVPQFIQNLYGGKINGDCADFLRPSDMLYNVRDRGTGGI